MYAPGYGYPSTFNNAAPPPNQQSNPVQYQHQLQQQPGPVSGQPAQQEQKQHIMYNPNQYAMPGGQGAPGSFPGQANPGMMPGAGPAGMMQNTAMQQMPPNGQMAYQNQFQGNAFQGNVPTSAGGQQLPPNYMAGGMPGAGAGMSGFQMNQGMTPQQQQMMQQRMQQQQQQQQHQQQHQQHPHQQQHQQQNPQQQQHQQQLQQQHQQQHPQQHQVGATPQRPPSSSQGTPNMAQQPMPQQHQQQHAQQPQQPSVQTTQQGPSTSNPQQPQSSTSIATPQTPTFPTGGSTANMNGAPGPTPLSPGTESKDKDRMAVLLEINQELLFESIQLQNTIQELKKAASAGDDGDQSKKAEAAALSELYTQCMRRLQGNLAYQAALADRKGNVPVPPHPAYLTSPTLQQSLKSKSQTAGTQAGEGPTDTAADREESFTYLSELYDKLQALFPGIDPTKEPSHPQQRPQGPPGQGPVQGQRPGGQQGSPTVAQHQGVPTA